MKLSTYLGKHKAVLRGFFILARLKISVYLVAIFLTVSMAAKAIESLQPPKPALRGFVEGCEDKPQPCWYGIVPGITHKDEARETIEKSGYQLASTEILSSYITPCEINCCKQIDLHPGVLAIPQMDFSQCFEVFLGDLMNTFDYSLTPFLDPGVFSLLDGKVLFYPGNNIKLNPYTPIANFTVHQYLT